MSDAVLTANDRGHTAQDVIDASRLIRSHGFSLGLQMMTGLYKSSDALDRYTARQFVALRPDTVRIYPTIVMRGTRLGELYLRGEYRSQELEEAVALCADLLTLFEENGVKVIRLGLHDSESLKRDRLAGPYHPAFRELCESRIMLDKALFLLREKEPGEYTLHVSPKSRSKMTGNKKSNLISLQNRGYDISVSEDDSLKDLEVNL